MQCSIYQSAIGALSITSSDNAIIEITFGVKEGASESVESAIIEECKSQLNQYFSGKRTTFNIPFELTGTEFQNKVWQELLKIPFGKAISYTELALRLGNLKSIRAAGTANGKNKLPIIVPCHRVIGKDGSLVGFAGGLDKKKWLLKHEGVIKGEQMMMFS